MRTTLYIASAIFIVACAWGEEAGPPEDEDPEIPVCGDGTCAASEVSSCATDCGTPNPVTCNNNGTCDSGETTQNCAKDCTTSTVCNNNSTCDAGEDANNCPNDCNTTGSIDCNDDFTMGACFVCVGSAGDSCEFGTSEDACWACWGISSTCPNGTCDPGEDSQKCPADCP